jgi:hypothetical protein
MSVLFPQKESQSIPAIDTFIGAFSAAKIGVSGILIGLASL